MEKITFLRLYSNLINIVNIKILSSNFFSKTTNCPFLISQIKKFGLKQLIISTVWHHVVMQLDLANGLNKLHTDMYVCVCVFVCV